MFNNGLSSALPHKRFQAGHAYENLCGTAFYGLVKCGYMRFADSDIETIDDELGWRRCRAVRHGNGAQRPSASATTPKMLSCQDIPTKQPNSTTTTPWTNYTRRAAVSAGNASIRCVSLTAHGRWASSVQPSAAAY